MNALFRRSKKQKHETIFVQEIQTGENYKCTSWCNGVRAIIFEFDKNFLESEKNWERRSRRAPKNDLLSGCVRLMMKKEGGTLEEGGGGNLSVFSTSWMMWNGGKAAKQSWGNGDYEFFSQAIEILKDASSSSLSSRHFFLSRLSVFLSFSNCSSYFWLRFLFSYCYLCVYIVFLSVS